MISNLKKVRLLQEKTQRILEQETGIHQTMLSLFENGFREPNKEQKKILAKALKAPEKELFPE
jgi:transcriptional regulator with XRE-family HTH domain